MKLITAIVRPDKLEELIGTLIDNQVHGLTVTEVRGFGRQFGQLAPRQARPGWRCCPRSGWTSSPSMTTWKP